jgi:hypothetical protein
MAMKGQRRDTEIDLTTANGAAELESRVHCRLGGQIREFRLVQVDDGLILRGHAHTYYAKQVAQQAVMEATQRPILANEIEVLS